MIIPTANVCAADTVSPEEEHFIINDEIIVPYGQDYENPETGEYFRWMTNENERGTIAKKFTFMVRYSVTSSSFTVNSTKVSVDAGAYVGYMDETPAPGSFKGHAYRVEVIKLGLLMKIT